ncbi:MAG: PorV/PorQ family protein [Bacteroidota bacterium]
MRLLPPLLRRTALLAALLAPALAPAAQQVAEREKLAQTGLKFLSVAGDPRAASLSSATTALEGGAEMLFTNPAGMAWMEPGSGVSLSQTGWIADIDYSHSAVAFQPAGGRYGVVGVSLAFVDYGEFQETVRADNDQGFVDVGTFSPTALAVGLGYARAVSDRFSVGGQVKYARQDLGDVIAGVGDGGSFSREAAAEGTLAYDFGVHYKTGFESLRFAVSARNFAPEVIYAEESFQLPLTFQIGVAMDVVDLTSLDPSTHSLRVSADAANPRDFSEQIRLGGEYVFANTLALRGGYTFPTDQEGISLGAGVQQALGGVGFGADYSYTDFGVFSGVHRVAVRFSL